jgi:protein-disulfide isomerase
LSEELAPEAAPLEEETGAPSPELAEADEPQERRGRSGWIAPAWFFFGIVVGILGFAAYNALIVKPPTATPSESLDSTVAMRAAARDGVLEAIATLQAGGGQPAAQEPQGPQEATDDAFTIRAANQMGDPGAPITIIEFADYQCPYCKRYHDSIGPDLLSQYVTSGKASFVYKHSAFLGQESIWAAQAAECAADQDKFWEYHELLWKRWNGENQGAFVKENLIGFAKELKLDMAKFEPCLQNDETLQRVVSDTQEGRQVGVTGTPTFFINGKPLVGAQPLQAFKSRIDAMLGQ